MSADYLSEIFGALQLRLAASLQANRVALTSAVAKGCGTEEAWIAMLREHLPSRYQLAKAVVVDCTGRHSNEIDIVVHDRQYTPVLCNSDNQVVLPAESVYAVFEVKQQLDRRAVEYAGAQAASVRTLKRTSAPIVHAGGKYEPRSPFPILAGILAQESSWRPPLGNAFEAVLAERPPNEALDLGCAVDHGAFEVTKNGGQMLIRKADQSRAIAFFFIRLLARLQKLATAPAIDFDLYGRSLISG